MAFEQIECVEIGADQLVQALDSLGVKTLSHIYMIDVGQGDCFALVDQDEKICLYVDYGGLADHPDKDDPDNTRKRMPDVHPKGQVPVLLTHWDKDHYWSAKKKNPHARKSEWIVPRQKVSPQAVRFSTEVDNMRCWPESLGSTPAFVKLGKRQLQVRKCDAYRLSSTFEDRNVTGLAVSIYTPGENDNPGTMCILPGDCPPQLIPGLPKIAIAIMAAHHHGSRHGINELYWRFLLTRSNAETLIISHGINHYGHPDLELLMDVSNNIITTSKLRPTGNMAFAIPLPPEPA